MHFDPSASHLGCTVDFAIISVPNRLRHCLISERHFHLAQRAIRFSATTDKEIQAATRKRGFSSPTAFIRHLVEQELSGRREELVGAEERLVASIERAGRKSFGWDEPSRSLFAFLDSLAKVVLTCVPEPGGEAMEAAVARARGRPDARSTAGSVA